MNRELCSTFLSEDIDRVYSRPSFEDDEGLAFDQPRTNYRFFLLQTRPPSLSIFEFAKYGFSKIPMIGRRTISLKFNLLHGPYLC